MSRRGTDKLLHLREDGKSHFPCVSCIHIAEAFFRAVQAKFFTCGVFAFAAAFDYAARHQHEGCTGFQSNHGSIASGMGEEAKRQSCGWKFDNAAAVTNQPRRMPTIEITKNAQILVVATCKGGARTHAASRFH